MKIKIELNYPDEQIAFFAQSRNKPEDKEIGEFCSDFLTTLLTQVITQPFQDNLLATRREEEREMIRVMGDNAQAGITVTVE